MRGRIEHEIVEAQDVGAGPSLTAKECPQTRKQLDQHEGLRDVVVGVLDELAGRRGGFRTPQGPPSTRLPAAQ